ncbi:GNAT family N-acetyltransferase [Rhizobium cauense]|uniref:GNAT family N-acetyltransferase n=1 Tax=Rhizobium cauense TaxID=1166683 RepID=UPI001C6E472E|nr:GNAT family N-acetyltransferase [Rhizobium cauense]MBW9116476.1 GNAT family N-acetyltransferase [Rhizobium cauense]
MTIRTQTFKLRPSVEDDYDAIAEIWHSSASLPGVGPPIMPTENELRERVDLEFAAGWSVTVAVRENDLIGFVAIKPKEAVLDQLFVRPGSIGAGVGQALLAHSVVAMPKGFTLFTRSGNAKARRFYEKAGLVWLRDDVHPCTGDLIACYGWKVG